MFLPKSYKKKSPNIGVAELNQLFYLNDQINFEEYLSNLKMSRIFDKKYGEWLGCHMIGYNVTEMIAEAVVARKLETTGHEILKSVHPHPTMSEAVMEAVADAYDEVIHL